VITVTPDVKSGVTKSPALRVRKKILVSLGFSYLARAKVRQTKTLRLILQCTILFKLLKCRVNIH
jgi:hypothetical protein